MSLNTQTDSCLKRLTKTPIVQIPNFIANEEIIETHRIRAQISTVVYVGGMIETKGAYEILRAARKNPHIIFRCIGTYDEEVKKYAE